MGKQKTMTLYERALEEGKLEGKLEGRTEKALETARRMRDFGDSLEKISIVSGLSEVELRENGIM
jgi:predicted transposase/invertase (TIGR01784 family)